MVGLGPQVGEDGYRGPMVRGQMDTRYLSVLFELEKALQREKDAAQVGGGPTERFAAALTAVMEVRAERVGPAPSTT